MRLLESALKKQAMDLSGLECYNLNSNILPCIEVGMYNSLLDPDVMYEDEMENYRQESPIAEFLFERGFDNERYKQIVFDCASCIIANEVEPVLETYGVAAIRPTGIYSPRWYNFETDSLDFDVYLKPDFYETMHLNMEQFRRNASLQRYIERHYWHRDGFVSFMPKSFDEVEAMEKPEQCIAAYLTFCLLVEGEIVEGEQAHYDQMYQEVHDHGGGWDCCDITHYGETDEAEELLLMYAKHPDALNDLLWDVFYKLGHQWRGYKPTCWQWEGEVTNDLMAFTLWAIDKGYSLSVLRTMAA